MSTHNTLHQRSMLWITWCLLDYKQCAHLKDFQPRGRKWIYHMGLTCAWCGPHCRVAQCMSHFTYAHIVYLTQCTPNRPTSVGHNNSLEPTLFITMRGFRYPTLMFNPCQLSNFRLIWATQNCICSRKLKRVSILFHAWCWSEISRKTKGKIPDFGHPQVGHINKFHGNLTPALIELISVVIAWTKSWMVKVLVICVPQMHPTSPLSYHVHLRQGSTSIDFG